MSFEIVFQPDGKRGQFKEGTSVLEAARKLGVDINSICGGAEACGKCVIKVTSGKNPPALEKEKKHVNMNSLKQRYRLACSLKIMDNLVVLVPEESRTGTQRLQTEGMGTTVTIDNQVDGSALGFAVDIGSTKLAGYLMELATGRSLAVATSMNPQIPYGEDIISRINYAIKTPENNRELHEILAKGVRELLDDACSRAGKPRGMVTEIVLVGNTAMQHFILGTDPSPLSRSPFMPASLVEKHLPPGELSLAENAHVYIPPIIAGFVGADCVAATLATGLKKAEKNSFLMDIGTNTEIVVGNRDGMVSCSCASGPAFEGAHIKHGMRAATGAIEGVWIDPETLEPSIRTIDDVPPKGLCGSGLIDLLSEMLKTGIMDSTGRFTRLKHPRIRKQGAVYEYVLDWGEETGNGEPIVITQLDIRELQKGKAAIYAGAYVAMNKLDLEPEDLYDVFVAGAFGTYIDRKSAVTIGMIPEFNQNKIKQVGNAAGTGARMILLSGEARETAEEIPKKMDYIELAMSPIYNQEYLDALMFPHKDLSRFPETAELLEETGWVMGRLHKRG